MGQSGREIAMRCTKCGRRWNPASTNATWSPCACGNSNYTSSVTFGDFPDGSRVAAEWQDLPDLSEEAKRAE